MKTSQMMFHLKTTYLLLLLSALVACARSKPPPPDSTEPMPAAHAWVSTPVAAPPASSGDISPELSARFGPQLYRLDKAKSDLPRATKFKEGDPADPRIAACMKSATKIDLADCLELYKTNVAIEPGRLGAAVRPPLSCAYQTVPAWFVSPVGSNLNGCVDSAHPCLTMAEIEMRWGCGGSAEVEPTVTQGTTITFLGDMPLASAFVVRPILQSGGSFTLQCSLTQTSSGILSGVVPKSRVPAGQALNVNIGAGAATHVNQILINTTRSGSSYIDAVVSGNVVQMQQPLDGLPFNPAPGGNEVDTYANGDSYTIQNPSLLYMTQFSPTCGLQHSDDFFPHACADRVRINDCHEPATTDGAATFVNSRFAHVLVNRNFVEGISDFDGAISINTNGGISPHNFTNGGIIGGSVRSPFFTGVGDQYADFLLQDAMIHGTVVFPTGSVAGYDHIYCDPGQQWFIQGQVFSENAIPAQIYGNCTLTTQFFGMLTYGPTAVTSFSSGTVLQTDLGAFARTNDLTHQPAEPIRILPLSIAALDHSINDPVNPGFSYTNVFGGSSGEALNSNLTGGYYNWQFSIPPLEPYIAQPFTAIGGAPTVVNLAVWYRTDFLRADGSNHVISLSDQSANNIPEIQTGSANWPTFVPATKLMTCNGADPDFLNATANIVGSTNTTMFVVMKASAGGTQANIFASTSLIIADNAVGSNWGTNNGPWIDSGHNVDDGKFHVLVLRTRNFNDIDLITDGQKTTSNIGNVFNNFGTGGVCSRGGVSPYTGTIGEIYLYSSLFTDEQVDGQDRYLSSRYGVPMAYSTTGRGTTTLTGTTPVTVLFPYLNATSSILVGYRVIAGSAGHISAPTRTPGVSFTVVSDNVADTSTVDWAAIN